MSSEKTRAKYAQYDANPLIHVFWKTPGTNDLCTWPDCYFTHKNESKSHCHCVLCKTERHSRNPGPIGFHLHQKPENHVLKHLAWNKKNRVFTPRTRSKKKRILKIKILGGPPKKNSKRLRLSLRPVPDSDKIRDEILNGTFQTQVKKALSTTRKRGLQDQTIVLSESLADPVTLYGKLSMETHVSSLVAPNKALPSLMDLEIENNYSDVLIGEFIKTGIAYFTSFFLYRNESLRYTITFSGVKYICILRQSWRKRQIST